jgi:arylsulfatase A-like enzyme
MARRHVPVSMFATAITLCSFAQANEKPNIVFLLADDQRADSVGAYGNPLIHTPEMDRLAAEGVLFKNAFAVSSACAPSRANIFSGLYARTSGIRGFAETFSPEQLQQIYPVLLRNAGYRTGFIGKWGVGSTVPETMKDIPALFDYWRGFVGQGTYWPDGKEGRHLTQIMAAQADEFFTQAAGTDQPFCLSISFKAPHGPWNEANPEFTKLYREEEMPFPATLTEEAIAMLPAFMRTFRLSLNGTSIEEMRGFHQRFMLEYYALISGIDHALGSIRQSLEERGLAENTIIVYTSDQGHFVHEFGFHGKWLMYEPSIGIPLMVYDPRLPEPQRGRRMSELALTVDFAPTLLDWAGVPVPEQMQGRSLVPLICGEKVPDWRNDFFYEYRFGMYPGDIPTSIGVRTERWKYVRYPDESYEQLFDLYADPCEINNLADNPRLSATKEKLQERLKKHRRSIPDNAPIWNEYGELYKTVTTGSVWPDMRVDFHDTPQAAQSFIACGNFLRQVNWMVPFFQQGISPADLHVRLLAEADQSLIAETTVPKEQLYSLYPVGAVLNADLTPGRTYRLEFSPAGAVGPKQLQLWAFPEDTFVDGTLYLNGEESGCDLSLEFVYEKTESE